ncbi:MAG: sulfurtransferase TusA family protein [Fidelibacterota bacterium]|nr:MAG: sulfurtransferase TusA family protein [Candidatus Neomarinimicrobiota bacterium]
MSEPFFDQELDCQGLLCPLPVLKTKQVLDSMGTGKVLRLLATDPGSVSDMEAWTRQTGNELLDHREGDGVYTYYVRKV